MTYGKEYVRRVQTGWPTLLMIGCMFSPCVFAKAAYEPEEEDQERENTHMLLWRQCHQYTPEEYQAALVQTGMLMAKESEWSGFDTRGAVWQSLGPTGAASNGNGRASGIHIRPVTGGYDVYLAASSGGIWRRANGSGNWSALGESLENLHVGGLWVDPANANKIAIGTGNKRESGSGFYYSDNGGASWHRGSVGGFAPTPTRVYKIVHNTLTANHLVAATNAGIYRSTDGGVTWNQILQGWNFLDVAVDGTNPAKIYACQNTSSSGVFCSTDFGVTWPVSLRFSNATDSDIPPDAFFHTAAIATCAGVANAVVLLVGYDPPDPPPPADPVDYRIQAVLRSLDGGTNWTNITGNISTNQSQLFHVRAVAMRPGNVNEVYVASVDLFRTTNANAASPSWVQIAGGHADVGELSFHPASGNNILWICNDGGLYRYNVGGATENWNGSNTSGLRISEMFGLDAERTTIITGLQDNAMVRSTNGGSSWTYHSCCDGMSGEIVDNRTGEGYYGAQGCPGCGIAFIDRLLPDGTSTNMNVPGTADNGACWFDRVLNRIYVQQRLENPDRKFILAQTPPAAPGAWTTEFAVPTAMKWFFGSQLDGTIYIPFWSGNQLLVAQRGSPAWSLTTRSYSGVASNPSSVYASLDRAGRAWVGCAGNPGESKILYHADFVTPWVDRTGNLASVRKVNAVVAMPFQENRLYAATDIGVFISQDGGGAWAPYMNGLPIVEVNDLTLIKRTTGLDTLVACTWGRGVWKADISGIPVTYVDDRSLFGFEDGTIEWPFKTLAAGRANVAPGGILALHSDQYAIMGPLTINTSMTLNTYNGAAIIGR